MAMLLRRIARPLIAGAWMGAGEYLATPPNAPSLWSVEQIWR